MRVQLEQVQVNHADQSLMHFHSIHARVGGAGATYTLSRARLWGPPDPSPRSPPVAGGGWARATPATPAWVTRAALRPPGVAGGPATPPGDETVARTCSSCLASTSAWAMLDLTVTTSLTNVGQARRDLVDELHSMEASDALQ